MSWISGMKCVCGYTYKIKHGETRKDPDVKLAGDEDFIEIEGTFLTSGRDVYLYACPKCGTIRTDAVHQYMDEED